MAPNALVVPNEFGTPFHEPTVAQREIEVARQNVPATVNRTDDETSALIIALDFLTNDQLAHHRRQRLQMLQHRHVQQAQNLQA